MKYRLIIYATLLFSLGANAQEVMTLEKCRELALKNNKQLGIANLTSDKSKQTVAEMRANFLPNFSASGNYLLTSSKIKETMKGGYLPTYVPDANGDLQPNVLTSGGVTVVGADGNPVFKEYAYMPDKAFNVKLSGTYTVGLSAEQPIYTGGKISAAYKMSKIGEEVAQENLRLTSSEVIAKTDEAYWLHVKANEMLKAAQSYKKVVAEFYRNIENAKEVGLRLQNDVLKVQVKVNEAELQLRKTENAVRLSRINLCHMIGVSLDSEVKLPESFDDAQIITVNRSLDISSRPEYAMLNHQIKLKEQEVKLIRSDYLPRVGVMGSLGYSYGLKMNGSPLLDKSSMSAIVSISIPIFHWGEGSSKIKVARIERQIAEQRKSDLDQKMEMELVKALNDYDEAILEVELTSKSLTQAEENLRLSLDQFELGRETLADHLEAQTIWQKAWAEMINAKANQRICETHYLKAAGILE